MPELPEVETVRKGLTQHLQNFYINHVEVCRERAIASGGGASIFIDNMTGKYVGRWYRRGKFLIASMFEKEELESIKKIKRKHTNNGWWVIHLRMTGQFIFLTELDQPCSHTRVRFWNEKGHELRFVDTRSFGQMWWVPPQNKPEEIISGLNKLGPEPFSANFNPAYLIEKLRGKSRSIKSALLDQSVVAGTGNIYADESLFMAGISPQKKAGELTSKEVERLCQSLVKILKISIGAGGTTFSSFRDIEGVNGKYGGQAWVYGRVNKPCRKCGSKIKKIKLTGRGTHWCPYCQK